MGEEGGGSMSRSAIPDTVFVPKLCPCCKRQGRVIAKCACAFFEVLG